MLANLQIPMRSPRVSVSAKLLLLGFGGTHLVRENRANLPHTCEGSRSPTPGRGYLTWLKSSLFLAIVVSYTTPLVSRLLLQQRSTVDSVGLLLRSRVIIFPQP